MTDPKRLVDEGDLGATLLASAATDGPSGNARQRAALALGLAAGTAAIASSAGTAAAAGAGAGAGASAGAGVAAKVGGVGLFTKIFIGAVVSVGVAGGAVVVAKRTESREPVAVSAIRTVSTTATATAPAPVAEPPVAVPIVTAPTATAVTAAATTATAVTAAATTAAAATATPRAKETPATAATAATASASPETALGRELRSLDVARNALARGDANAALAALDRHDRAFPAGALSMESSVTRVDALVARGDKAAARSLAQRIVARDPSGPQARRMRAIAESTP